MKSAFARRLDIFTNIATISVLLLFAVIAVQRQCFPANRLSTESRKLTGTELHGVQGIEYDRSEKTLVILASATCKYCHQSMPFYQRLFRASAAPGNTARLVFVHPKGEMGFDALLNESQIKIPFDMPSVYEEDFKDLPIASTPTLILVDHNGRIKRLWFGKLQPGEEAEVLQAIS